jgi:hypothetical protein
MSPKNRKPNLIKFPIRQLFKVIVLGHDRLIILNYTIQWADSTKRTSFGERKEKGRGGGSTAEENGSGHDPRKIWSSMNAHRHLLRKKVAVMFWHYRIVQWRHWYRFKECLLIKYRHTLFVSLYVRRTFRPDRWDGQTARGAGWRLT